MVGCSLLVLIADTNNGVIMNIKIAAITPLPLILETVTQFPRKHLTHCLRYSEVLSAIFQCHISQKSVHCHSNTFIAIDNALCCAMWSFGYNYNNAYYCDPTQDSINAFTYLCTTLMYYISSIYTPS